METQEAVSWEPEGIHGEVKGKHKEELLEKILPTNIFKYNAKRIRCPQNMSSFMLKTCIVREEWRSKVPAIVHVDDSSRPQYLCQEDNELLYGLLQEYYDLTSIPMIVNTSFNTHGRPIVNSPREALIEFEKEKGIDILVIGNYYIER